MLLAGESAALPEEPGFLTRHRLFAAVLAVAAVLRVVTMLGYRPAALYWGDSYWYLYMAVEFMPSPGFQPSGYPFLLLLLRPFHSVAVIVAVQHLLGLAVGVMIYATLRRRSLPAWSATLAAAPALLDASFLALEHAILSDTLFTFLVVAATTVLLWSRTLSVKAASGSGLLLAWAALTRSVGVPLVALVTLHCAARRVGWRPFAALVLTSTLPLAAYATWYNAYYGRFALAGLDGVALWARTMTFADCTLIQPPSHLAPLCPNQFRVDAATNYVWGGGSSLNLLPGGMVTKNQLARGFALLAISAQPLDYLGEIVRDTALAFDWTRSEHPRGGIRAFYFGIGHGPLRDDPMTDRIRRDYAPALTGIRSVEPYAGFLFDYQEFTQLRGPLLAAILLLGGLGSLGRRRAALLPWGIAVELLVVPVAVLDFDHRYVLPAVPIACLAAALAAADLVRIRRTLPATTEASAAAPSSVTTARHRASRRVGVDRRGTRWAEAAAFTAILAVYAALLVPTIDRQGIGWDEQVDLTIAGAYLTPGGWLTGSPLDLSQTCLPMFIPAVLFWIVDQADLLLGRWVSALVGALTLLGVYVYGRSHFGVAAGLLGAGLLAINPFFLSFARVAFTESDVYLACAFVWLALATARLASRPSLGPAAGAGVLFGLALSAKATALAIVPAFWLPFIWVPRDTAGSRSVPSSVLASVGWATAFLLIAVAFNRQLASVSNPSSSATGGYLLVLAGWSLLLAFAAHRREVPAAPLVLAAFVTALGLLTAFVVPPEHLANPGILASLGTRAEHEGGLRLSFMAEAGALHLACIGLKSSLALGAGLLLGVPAALTQWWTRRELRVPLLLAGGYLAGLVMLPLAQVFYAVPLLPLLSLLAADQFLRLLRARKRLGALLAAIVVTCCAVEIVRCYPDYNLNGYQWVGERVLFGRSSIGYQSLVMTPSDGVEQSVAWLNDHARRGETAVLFVEPLHIVRATARRNLYQLVTGTEAALRKEPAYVVTHINASIDNGWGADDTPRGGVIKPPYDAAFLTTRYAKVFSVRRAFGIEVASIWKHR